MNQTRRATTTRPGAALGAAPASDLKPPSDPRPIRVLRFEAVRDRTGLSRSTIWRLERRGTFPRHRRISLNAVGWLEEEVDQWIRSCASL
ncbi:MAG: AlpA family phage regulatory protein [Vicinamibacterales bacterium]